ncbi:MAG: Asp-tRNA(Asn)/Glu-tRNA(Gln) amidotransferase subunit GatB [Oscillospiraceae bacterium]|nr:Asp-tRNA(Asn)/Glu-tRNA(Gln) amidotransferase subunit GatB [Oscillospiraceae bacterium]
MKYEVVIGLEVHIELSTESKLFCSCPVKFDAAPNENICPACAGMPGIPPVLNKRAVELGIIAGLVTNSKISSVTAFDKKNYFYPDLPTGYQITQFFAPICKDGYIDIELSDRTKRITLKQIHIEEDAGKLVHTATSTLVDLNRAGVPLIEVVSNPDFSNAEEVIAYLEKLRSLMTFASVSDCKMQEGSMRCDVNLSVRETGAIQLGTRTEIKNMSSFKSITEAIEYESNRHIEALETMSEVLVQETRGWDDDAKETYAMREKENFDDYRYFPNPEIMPVVIDSSVVDKLKRNLPEMAHEKLLRLTEQLKLPVIETKQITASKTLSDIFDSTLALTGNPKEVLNWIVVELLSIQRGENKSVDDIVIDTKKFADIIKMVEQRTINRNVGKKLLQLLVEQDINPTNYVTEHNLIIISDNSSVESVVDEILNTHQGVVSEFLEGNQKVYGFLVGQTMKQLGGKADPKVVNELLRSKLASME